MKIDTIINILAQGLAPHERRIEQACLEQIAQEYLLWRNNAMPQQEALGLCIFLRNSISQISQQIEARRERHGDFNLRLSAGNLAGNLASNLESAEHDELVLQYAAEMGATGRALRQDRRALKRWFGIDALGDRYARMQALLERRLSLSLRQLGHIAASYIAAQPEQALANWQQLSLETTVLPLFTHIGNGQIRIDAFVCLATAVVSLPKAQQEGALGHSALQYIYRSALDHSLNIWIQCAALKLLQTLSPANFLTVAKKRLQQPRGVDGADDLFVRRRIINVLVEQIAQPKDLFDLFKLALRDPSPYVRQGAAIALVSAPGEVCAELFPCLLLLDAEPKVRACAAMQLPALAQQHPTLAVAEWLAQALEHEQTVFPLRVLLRSVEQCVIECATACAASEPQKVAHWLASVNDALDNLHQSSEYQVRRWCAQTAETLWLYSTPERIALVAPLASAMNDCKPGDYARLPKQFNHISALELGRILAVLNRHDYGVSLEKTGSGWRLWRGHRFGFRLWRWLHELRHPSTDKRQAFRHTIGRLFRGQVRVPSTIMAEMSETKVPGEPLQLDTEAGWRPYLPLADELISALDEDFNAEPLRIYTAEGITEVRAPRGLLARIKAKTWLSVNFKQLAHLRNWREESQAKPDSYLQQVAKLGFKVKFTPHQYAKEWRWGLDPAVGRFFSLPLPLALLGSAQFSEQLNEQWARFENYFFSSFENSLFDLTLFTLAGLGLFVGNHIYQNWLMQRARNAIPLVVGGWGTRGKSGTERIKAALFNALGYSVVSKTTGCEAMFLHGHPFDDLREMFLFRPYDKATIWEQHHLVGMSPKLGCEVFLWECMALTPDFVQLLQRSWMRDDISTITNTIPDHEDLQGPAGINIPQVMTNFIPPKGVVITSEEQMRPILRSAADKLGTRMVGVGWLESGMLTPDVLARFPYQEHPDNISLVLAMGRELGIREDFALKEMADRVVPDLGVLKTYPLALVAGRKLSFVNGMSANERFGCIGNWNRVGFDKMDYEQQPGVFISTVVNNRGDRVARSRVFANILVEDLRADRHFLIGSNLAGLQGYIREAWDAHAQGISLWPTGVAAEQVLDNFARHMRVAFLPQHISQRLEAMLQGQGLQRFAACLSQWQDQHALKASLQALNCQYIDATLDSISQAQQSMQEYTEFKQKLQKAAANDDALNQAFRDLLWLWFSRKLVVVEDYYASGDSIIQMLAEQAPPGFENRVMGIQNIKGTGLGFIYCWQAWDACHVACQGLQSRDPALVERSLAALGRMQNFGLLSEQHLRQALAQAAKVLQNERQQGQLAQIENNLQKAMEEVRQKMGAKASSGWLEKVCSYAEGFLDAGDAVLRRRKANQIYRDLASLRISHARAAMELQVLTQRQKGGWLYQAVA